MPAIATPPTKTMVTISPPALRFGLVLALGLSSIGFAFAAFAPWFAPPDALPTTNFPGNDFNAFLAAARLALDDPLSAYDVEQMTAAVVAQIGRPIAYSWAYPPLYFFYVMPLAALPLLPALLLWWLATTGGLVAAVAAVTRLWWMAPAALLFPATIVNLMMGQNGSLSALILLLGLAALGRRPILAGAVLGLLAYKPHLALLLPIGLIAGRHWRALFSMGGAGLALAGLSLIAFGWASWEAFLTQLPEHAQHVLEGRLNWKRIPTPLVAAHHLGAGLGMASVVQAVAFCGALAGCAWVWRRTQDSATRAMAIAAGSFLASPYAFDYDLVLLAAPAALLAAGAARAQAGSHAAPLIALAWLAPYVSWIGAEALGFPIGPAIIVALFGLTLLRAARLDQPVAAAQAERAAMQA